jgi:hypothetical protein
VKRLTIAEPWAYASLAALALLLAIPYANKASEDRSAFCRWRSQILAMGRGEDISARYNYPNPPIMAVLLEPLALLPATAGAVTWYLLKAGLAAVSLWWAISLVGAGGGAFPPWARLLAVSLALKPILDDLSHGNVNLFILFLCMGCLAAYRLRLDLLAGVTLALAIACKVTPALFLPYFLWKRAWRVLAGCAVGLLLFLYPGLVPAARLGMDANLQQLRSWYGVMVRPFVSEGKVTSEHINQSLPGALFRLATHSPSFVIFVNDIETPARYDNLLSLPPEAIKVAVKGCLLLFAALIVLTCRSPRRDGWEAGAEYSLIFLGMLLFSERTWKHHAVTLALPFAALAYRMAWMPTLWARAAVAASAVLLLLPALAGNASRDTVYLNPDLGKMSLVYGAYTAMFLIQAVTLTALLRGAGSLPWAIPIPDDEASPQARAA